MSEMSTTENKNKVGLELKNYDGSPSTLCVGCGHDLISKQIMTASFQADISPTKMVKMSGIGCSSKIPAYFMSNSFAFNSMHGRMASVTTGAQTVRPDLKFLGISGDGDTGNIGMGGFIHLVRRNVDVVYIIANNGVFGLTKGQFSATAELGSLSKGGDRSFLPSLDFCALALEAGCGFVARTFSGDSKQMVGLLKAAFKHRGTAVIDVISPCIAFNNHEGSTKSYTFVKEHDRVLQELGFISPTEEILADYEEGQTQKVELPDGTHLLLKKLQNFSHDVTNANQARELLKETQKQQEILTGLFYINENRPTFDQELNLTGTPLNELQEADLKPSREDLLALQRRYW